ncbi:AAA family ATPase [Tessaracoccus sp. MC1865]|uniref:AAA family ATPase n=1 Tax=Tessaracoccus sp. MC1865 TaxID=2760310 RepID=UPI0015FECCD5|nr:AAA family ATPase [Tessaracoccus sp. MC1865]MBB1484592.1 AAA family ATPase [Tessaracoccus sp. MC1865]QTO38320.1 AAA family ATPase [Tessaracoccus sp. MC1865]
MSSLFGRAAIPDVVVLDATGVEDAAMRIASDLAQRADVLLVHADPGLIGVAAVRAGVRDIIPADAEPHELRAALDRAADRVFASRAAQDMPGMLPPPVSGRTGVVVTVTSPKGGVGKTTVATNLAVGLAQRFPQQVVLIDADVHFGDVASALNLQAQHSLPDIARGPAARDSIAVKSYVTQHVTGLFVVPGSDSPADADTVTGDDLAQLVSLLRGQFAYVVIDTAPGLTDHTLAALDHTDHLVLVTSLDVPGVRGLRKEIDTLNDLKMITGKRTIVVNFNERSRGMTIADVEATIRAGVDVALPQSNGVPLSTNQGIPLLQSGGRDPVSKGLLSLVDAVAPQTPTSARGRLFRRNP